MNENQFPKTMDSALTVRRAVESTACGKAIIVGEHAAVYGVQALAMPLRQMRFRFILRPMATRVDDRPDVHLKLGGHEVSRRIQSVVLKAMEMFGDSFSIHAESHSTLPIGAGLGSSATLCVAVLRALSASCNRPLSRATLADWANELEKSFHGNPSGLDTAVVAFEECVLFAKGQPVVTVAIPDASRRLEFVLIDSNIRASTLAMIRIAQPYFLGSEGERLLQSFERSTIAAHSALQSGDACVLGEAMSEAGRLLERVGVVPPALQSMIAQANDCGLLAAKTTGAGGGGMILGLLDPERADEQYKAIRNTFDGHAVYRVGLNGQSH